MTTPTMAPRAEEWRPISPKFVPYSLLGSAIWAVILLVLLVIGVAIGAIVLWIIALFFLLLILAGASLTWLQYRTMGYQLRRDDLVFKRGVINKRVVAIPYGRLQLVDVRRGAIERVFGLSSIHIVTAASAANITIPGLPVGEGEQLRDHLIAVAETRRAGL